MNLIDTHSHLFSDQFSLDLDDVVSRSISAGISKVLLPNIDVSSIKSLKDTVSKYPSFFYPMMGLHPTSVDDDWKSQIYTIEKELMTNSYIGVGEIGIDLYWSESYKEDQIKAFEAQLEISKTLSKPVSIHSRESFKEVVASIQRIGFENLSGVFHSFSGTVEDFNIIKKLKNFYIGINGVVTFKNSELDKVLKNCDINMIVIETDSPYLAPVPYRGKRNESSYIVEILKKLSDIFGLSQQKIAEITTKNAKYIFNLK